jgi:hypothetical protein
MKTGPFQVVEGARSETAVPYLEIFQVMLTASGMALTDSRLLFGFFFPRMTSRLAMV